MAKLILTHEVSGLGAPGDVVEVKDGYARNYLVPRGLATAWTRGAAKQIEAVAAAGGPTLDRRKIEIGQPIKSVGEHQVQVRLHEDVAAQIDVRVLPQD